MYPGSPAIRSGRHVALSPPKGRLLHLPLPPPHRRGLFSGYAGKVCNAVRALHRAPWYDHAARGGSCVATDFSDKKKTDSSIKPPPTDGIITNFYDIIIVAWLVTRCSGNLYLHRSISMADLSPAQIEFVEAVQKYVHSSQKAISKMSADLHQLTDRVDSLNATLETMLQLAEN